MKIFSGLFLQKNHKKRAKGVQISKNLSSALLLLPLIAFSACSRAPEDSETLANYRGVVPWPNGKIDVCVVEAESKDQRQLVQDLSTVNFKDTGVQFVGWNDCKANDGVKVRVFIGTANPKAYSRFLGSTLLKVHYTDAKASSLDANVFITHGNDQCSADQKKVVCLYNTALHVLAHVAGLYHQDESPLKKQPTGKCAFHSVDAKNENKEFIKVKNIVPGQFDKGSIMNDCISESFTQKKSLSPGDIATLKALYKVKAQEEKAETDPNNLNTYLGKPCNQNKDAAGKLAIVNKSVSIVCTENKDSATGFAWQITSNDNPVGVQCNHKGTGAGTKNGDLTCKEFPGSPTGWRWLK